MFFTQEDYRKIEKWLLANSRKDTEFAGAATPLKGNETVVLVQNGKNVKASVKDVVEQLFLLGVSDFVNITDKYGESYISLSQATELIPYRSRKVGQVVTFLDDTGKWSMYQFQGLRKNQWNTLSLWVDLIDLMKGMTVVDSEDIVTEVNSANQVSLKFADKTYNEADFSGLGRIYLRKNVVNVEDPVTGNVVTMNWLNQSMISKENTIYIIQYDYNLNKQTITIPSGCVLLFEGGSISNGNLKGNNTSIKANGNIRIFSNITIEGSILNDKIYMSWFNTAKGGDDTEEFRRAFKTVKNNEGLTITIDGNALYRLSDVVEVFSTTKVELTKGSTLLNTGNLGFEFGSTTQGVYKYDGYHDIVFYGGGTIDLSANPSGLNKEVNSAFRMYHARNILIEGITIMNSGNHHMIEVGGCQNVTFKNMKFIGFFHFDNLLTYKGECIQIEMARSGNGSDMPYFDRTTCDNITVEGCYFGPQVTFEEDGTQTPYGLIARGIGCHDELDTNLNDSFHTNINIVDNTFDRVYQACVSPRIMDKCLIKGNRALNLQGYFVCTFNSHSPSFTGSYYLPSQNLVIDSNYIEQEAGIQTIQAPSCMGNDYFNVYSLVGLENTVNVTITNNVFKNAQFYMIRCYNTQNTNINGNTFIDWAGLLREDIDYAIGFIDESISMMYPTGFKNVKVFNNIFTNANATNNLLSLTMNRTDVSVFGNTIKMASQLAASFKNMNNRMAFPLYTNSTYTDDTSEEGVIGTIALSDYPYNYSELQVFYTIPGYTNIFYSTYFNPIRNEIDGTNSDIMCSVMDTKSDNSLMLKQLHATLSNNNKNIVIDYNRIITHTIPESGTPTATRQIATTGAISGVGYIKVVKVLGLVANNVIANS